MTDSSEANGWRLASLLFLAPAAALSLGLMPDDWSLIPIVLLSFLRAIALIVGFVCLIATGRLDRWSKSRVWLGFLTVIGVFVVTCIVMSWQIMRDDYLPPVYAWTYIVLARLLPIALMASAFLPSKKAFVGCVVLTVIAGIVFLGSETQLGTAYAAQKEVEFTARRLAEDAATQVALEKRMAELAAVPADAGPEALFPFLDKDEIEKVRVQAIVRLGAIPNITEKLASLLDGNRRLDGLVGLSLLSFVKAPISDAITQRSWIVAASIARDMTPRMGDVKVVTPETVKLCSVLGWLAEQRTAALEMRVEHRADLVALRDWLGITDRKVSLWCGGGQYMVDGFLAAP